MRATDQEQAAHEQGAATPAVAANPVTRAQRVKPKDSVTKQEFSM
jgi:hypothetical protein